MIFSCGKISPKGSLEKKQISVESFVNLDLEGKFRVFYAKSNKSFIEIETYRNIAENLDIDVKDKTLKISENRHTKPVDFYNLTIYSQYNLEKIALSDSVELNISSEITSDQLQVKLKNTATFIGSVNTRKTEVEMQNRSRANFLGESKNALLKISDTASLIAPYWKIKDLTITSENGNYAEVNVRDSLKGTVKNTAKLVYYNDPVRAFIAEKTAHVQNKKNQ